MQLHSATAVEAARSTVRGIPRMPVLCTVPYPASYAQYRSFGSDAALGDMPKRLQAHSYDEMNEGPAR